MAQLTMAQLAINRLEIPNELLIIIKDFTWLTKERKKIMDLKLEINILVTFAYSPENPYGSPKTNNHAWWFQATDQNQFQAYFCNQCGNYYYYEFKTNAICKCR